MGVLVSDLTPAAQRWLADHHGVITTSTLRMTGVGRTTQQRLLERSVLRPAFKGVFVVSSTPPTLEQRCAALCAAHPAGFVTGPTAGALLGLRRMPRRAALHFAIRHGAKVPPLSGVHFRQTTALAPGDRRTIAGGIEVPTWARLAFDLAADLRHLDLLSVLNQLVHERRVTVAELVGIDRRLGHPARPGSGSFRRSLERLNGRAPHESHPEIRLAEALRARSIPIEQQHQVVRTSSGRIARLDLAVSCVRWGVELDIHPEHRTYEGQAADARRTRDLHQSSWQIEPVTEADLDDIDALCDELVQLYRRRCRAFDCASEVLLHPVPAANPPMR